jgi:hypothetical protein
MASKGRTAEGWLDGWIDHGQTNGHMNESIGDQRSRDVQEWNRTENSI